jgi:hypothetical protein
MAYGLEIYNSTGALTYSSNDVTWNQVDYFTVTALPSPQSVTKTYPIIIGKEVLILQLLIDAPPTNRRAIAHTIIYNNTATSSWGTAPGAVNIQGGSENALILVLMR